MKIVINDCYGGFGLSYEGVMRYAELKGIKLYSEIKSSLCTYYFTSPEDRIVYDRETFNKLSLNERQEYNKKYSAQIFNWYLIERNDPALIQVVEELGEKSFGQHSKLSIVEIPDDVSWTIEEYDGSEWVAETHRTWR
jgi:hypothetical protein